MKKDGYFSKLLRRSNQQPESTKLMEDEFKRYKAILSLFPDIIAETDISGRYTWTNQAGYDFFGDDVTGKEYATFFVDKQETLKYLEPLLDGSQETIYLESWQRRKDGSKRLLAGWCKGIRNSDGRLTGMLAAARDITGQKNNELNLLQRTIELESFFNYSIELLCIADINGYFHRLSKQWEEVLGYALKELEGLKFINLVHPDDVQTTLEAGTQGSDPKRITNFVNRYRHKDGSYRWLSWSAIRVDKAIYASARDITDERRIQEALRLSETRYKNLVENSPVVNYQLDTDGIFLQSEGKGLAGLGLKPGEAVGKSIQELYPNHAEILAAFEQAMSGLSVSFMAKVSGRTYDSFMEPVFDDKNQVTSIIGVSVDQTGLYQDSEEIRQTNSDLRKKVEELTARLESPSFMEDPTK